MFDTLTRFASRKLPLFLALILVPVLVAGGFLWGTWNANDRLHKVEAAVVNLDEAVTIDGQLIPLGRQLSANLVDTERQQNFTWVLADEAHAYPGLQSGRYAAVVVIPQNFSAAATSYADDPAAAKQATIQVMTSPVAGLADGVVGNVIADAAAKTLNETLTKAYLDRIYLGFNETGKQFVTVANGADRLADGAEELDAGVGELDSGASQLSAGLGQLSANSAKLTSGATQSASGADQLADGLETMSKRTASMPKDAKKLSQATQYVAGVNQLIDQTRASMAQLGDLAGGVDQLAGGADSLVGGLKQFRSGMTGLSQDPNGSGVPCPEGYSAEQCQAFYAGLATGTGIAAQQVGQAIAGAEQLSDGLAQLDQKLAPLANPDPNAAAQLTQLEQAGNQLAAGITQLASGLPQLADGIAQAATGSRKLATGLGQLSSGVSQYTAGVDLAASGASQLSGGVGQLRDGSSQLADGARELADGLAKGASRVPSYSEAERETLAQVVASPIQTTNLDTVVSPTTALASLLLVIALWLGALATYAVIPALRPGLALSTRSSATLLWQSLAPGALVTGAQALILAAIGAAALGLPSAKIAAVVGLLLIAAAAFVVVNHALAAWLGVAGRLIAVVLAVIGTASAITSAVPSFFDAIRPFSPVTPALDGIRAILTDSPGAAASAYGLVGWLLAGLAASAAAVIRARTVRASQVATLA